MTAKSILIAFGAALATTVLVVTLFLTGAAAMGGPAARRPAARATAEQLFASRPSPTTFCAPDALVRDPRRASSDARRQGAWCTSDGHPFGAEVRPPAG